MRDNNKAIYSNDENKVHDKDDGIHSMLEEVAEGLFANYSEENGNNVCSNMSEKEATTFDKLSKEVERELYPGCKKFLKLSFLVKFLYLQDPLMMMSLLILGPQVPGKDIDIYLHPLVDELKELWSNGVETFDTSTEKSFKMHAAVLWTISDFPAYEDYIIDKCLTFCSMYLDDTDTRFNRKYRNDDGSSNNDKLILDIFSKNVRPYKDGDYDAIPKKDFNMAQWYVLNNCEEAEPFLEKHKEKLLKQDVVDIEEKHREQFYLWFRRKDEPHYGDKFDFVEETDYGEEEDNSNQMFKCQVDEGIKKSDIGLAALSQWDLVSDKQIMQEEQPLQVARCTEIVNPNTEDGKYVINVNQIAKVFELLILHPKTYIKLGINPPKGVLCYGPPDFLFPLWLVDKFGCAPFLSQFVKLGIDPPKDVLCYGPPGTGKTLLARVVANHTDACFNRVIGSELVQKYVVKGARMVCELFQLTKKTTIQATGVASSLVETIQGLGLKLQTLNLSATKMKKISVNEWLLGSEI
ncbi:26S protease regulatory subunit 7 [Capsicum baccatum]|uniref:26S protease regulatory subunit 7 n=1 Tax=Capsicum baccatum TaxID=33114 RepID=A0A2G2WCN8_CAPBA|nr:26S protease regulatory subunit 7 [Capsicum baccatum]